MNPTSSSSRQVLFQLKRYGKGVLEVMEKNMKPETFQAFYDVAFPRYKQVVRSAYRLRGIGYRIQGDGTNAEMAERIQEVMPYTLVGIGGLEATFRLARIMNHEKIAGDFVELGVARGGAAALLAGVAFEEKGRHLWLFDSFEGLPDPTAEDFAGDGKRTGDHVRPLPKGSCFGGLEDVKNLLFKKFNFSTKRIHFVKGWFQDTLPVRKADIGDIALLRLDGDWYESTKVSLEHLYDKVVTKGAVIIDDYFSCFGCQRAVDEFLGERKITVELVPDGRGGCWFRKP